MDKNLLEIRWTETGKISKLEVVELSSFDMQDILKFQSRILKIIDKKENFVPLEPWELDYIVQGGGILYGLRWKDELLAYVGMVTPGDRQDNLAYDLKLPQESANHVAQLETALVHPSIRGNHVQFRLAQFLIEKAKESMDIQYVANTVSPYNIPSILTTLRLGLKIKALEEKYDGKFRYICCLDFANQKRNFLDVVSVHHTNIEKQKRLITEGYQGFGFKKTAQGLFLEYGK
jgi:hypothetical protein